MQNIEERVREIISKKVGIGIPMNRIMLHSHLDKLNLDELDIVELVLHLEEEFNLMIMDEDTRKFKTVKDIVDYLEKALL
jgi:acyl carrier protein